MQLFERKEVDRIVLSRPAVEAGERLGFLPGDMREKVDPYLRPIYDALYDLMDARIVERALQATEIEIAPLAFMRGRTLSNAAIILDEAQNTTAMQMKMLLTRLGENSRMVVTGDPSQVDLPPGQISGLAEAVRLLQGVEGIGHVAFTAADVIRHELVARIVAAYDNAAAAKRERLDGQHGAQAHAQDRMCSRIALGKPNRHQVGVRRAIAAAARALAARKPRSPWCSPTTRQSACSTAHWRGVDAATNVLSFPVKNPHQEFRQSRRPAAALGDIVWPTKRSSGRPSGT